MSAEKITVTETSNIPHIQTPITGEETAPKRVDINDLLARARKKNQKENFVNLIFLGVFASLILVVGIILSF
jgi:hypothetical protein